MAFGEYPKSLLSAWSEIPCRRDAIHSLRKATNIIARFYVFIFRHIPKMRLHPRRCVRNFTIIILLLFGTLTITKWRRKSETPSFLETQQQLGETSTTNLVRLATKGTDTEHATSRVNSNTAKQYQAQIISSPKKPKVDILLERLPRRLLILVYTLNGNEVKWVGEDREECNLDTGENFVQCPLERFEITYDKQRFSESNLVVFHANNMPNLGHLVALSKTRPISQRWVYHTMESPRVTPDPGFLKGFFNATWTYRSDSDFSAAYATYVPLRLTEKAEAKAVDYTKGKMKLVAWMVSNCGPRLRLDFVKQLKQFIDVDAYGRCSQFLGKKLSCSKSREKQCLKPYKFYLAFENALCKDYITEKYWEHLGDDNIVPVVMGGLEGDYGKLAIPGSYINVMDFKTVKELADYLHYLDRNNTAYNEYFKWRQKYQKSPYHYPLCNFCRSYALKSELSKVKIHHSLKDFWVKQGRCGEDDQKIYQMLTK